MRLVKELQQTAKLVFPAIIILLGSVNASEDAHGHLLFVLTALIAAHLQLVAILISGLCGMAHVQPIALLLINQ